MSQYSYKINGYFPFVDSKTVRLHGKDPNHYKLYYSVYNIKY